MIRRTTTVVTAAAGLVLGAGSFALAQTGGNPSTPGQSQQGMMHGGMMHGQMGANAQQGQQVDQQIVQQLQSFSQDPKTAPDKLFVLHAGLGNRQEIEFARQAEQKAQNQQVKQLAQKIIQDHTQAQQQLQPIAQQLGVQIPQELPEVKKQELQVLSSLPAQEFEKQFVSMTQADHAKDLIDYRNVAQTAQNQQVKQYAQNCLPKLSSHYAQSQQAAVALGLPSSGPEAIQASGRIEPGQSGQSGQGNYNSGNSNSQPGNMNRQSTSPEHSGPTPGMNQNR